VTEASSENLELAIVLPLGAVANQLLRIEADLRFLDMKALAYAKRREAGGISAQIAARLERINEALDLIRALVSDIETDIQPRLAESDGASFRDQASGKPRPHRDD
jgi:hypothetical protein